MFSFTHWHATAPHPLLLSTISNGIGIIASYNGYSVAYASSLCFGILLLLYYYNFKTLHYLIPLSLVLGSLNYMVQINRFEHFYEKYSQNSYTIQGVITNIESNTQKGSSYSATIVLNSINGQSFTNNFRENPSLLLYSNQLKNFNVDDTIELAHVDFKPILNPSFKLYLLKQDCLATHFIKPKNIITLIDRPHNSLKRWIHSKKNYLFARFKSKMSSTTFSFFAPLFLGYKPSSYYYSQLKERFKVWGLSHYLARSGLHLILFIGIWKYFFKFIPIAYTAKQLLFLLLSFLYFIFSWSSTPIIRAFLSFILSSIACMCDFQITPLHALTLVTYFLLTSNPAILFALDFQLSFGLTFALLWFNQIMRTKKIAHQIKYPIIK